MRILIVPAAYPRDASDFAGVFVRDQARVLATRHEVTVLAPRLVTPRSWLRGTRIKSTCTHRDGVREIEVPILNLSNRWERYTHRRWQRAMMRRGLDLLRAEPAPEILHAHFVRPAGRVALALAQRPQAVAVLTEHSGPFSVQTSTPWRRQETDFVLHAMDGVAAVSPGHAAEIQREFPRLQPAVLGNVVDETFFHPARETSRDSPARPVRFLFVGGLVPVKAFSLLIAALTRLRRELPAWELHVAGDGPLGASLREEVRHAGLEQQVCFLGSLSRTAVRSTMQGADVLILPSVVETFGVVLIEAMACGVPVVATDCGGPGWVVEAGCGLLVPIGDPDAMARAVTRVVREPSLFDRNVVRQRVVARFGRAAWLTTCEAFYEMIRARHPAGRAAIPAFS